MTWTVNDEEFEAVTRLAPEARYEYFVKRVADRGDLWAFTKEDPEARSGTFVIRTRKGSTMNRGPSAVELPVVEGDADVRR